MSRNELTQRKQSEVTRKEQAETFVPAADIWETPEEIIMRLDMPGVGKDNVEVKVDHDVLNIHGKVAAPIAASAIYSEQRIGDFHRQFSLSEELDRDKIAAKMDAGVLTIHIGKAEKVKPRTIQIQSAN